MSSGSATRKRAWTSQSRQNGTAMPAGPAAIESISSGSQVTATIAAMRR